MPGNEEEDGEARPGQGEVGVPYLALYHGESGYSAFTRGLNHQDDLMRKKKNPTLSGAIARFTTSPKRCSSP